MPTKSNSKTNNSNTEPKKRRTSKVVKEKTLKPSNYSNMSVPFERIKIYLSLIEKIATQKDPVEVALVVIEGTCKLLECDRTSFFFVDGDYLDLVIAKGATNIRLPKNTGFAGKCATEGTVLNIPDAYKDTSGLFNPDFDKKSGYKTISILCCPVTDPNGEIVGVLQSINKNNKKPFDQVDQSLFVSIAKQVGVSLRYAYEQQESIKAITQKNALISYIRSMNISTTAASVLFALNKAASELLEADRCTFYTINQEDKTMSIISADSDVDITLPIGKGIAGQVAKFGKTINIKDAYKDNRFDTSWDKKTGYKTKCMVVMAVFPDRSVAPIQTTLTKSKKNLFESLSSNNDNNQKEETKKKSRFNNLSPIPDNREDNIKLQLKDQNSNNDKKTFKKNLIKPKLPVAVVQLINKKDDMDNGFFNKDDEELLEVLLRFISPIVSNSSLFNKKKKKKFKTRI